jgi:AcrR family transcriptional regulator
MNPKARNPSHEISGVKAKALTAAADILATKGVDDLSLRAIAESAGIGIASIYHYFANKEELLLSLALMGFDDLRRDILQNQARAEFGSPMRGGNRAFFGFVRDRHALLSLMFGERLLARHAALREAEHRAFLAYKAAVESDDRIPGAHQENAAHALWALGRGMAATIASYPPGAVPEGYLERMFAGGVYLIDRPD